MIRDTLSDDVLHVLFSHCMSYVLGGLNLTQWNADHCEVFRGFTPSAIVQLGDDFPLDVVICFNVRTVIHLDEGPYS